VAVVNVNVAWSLPYVLRDFNFNSFRKKQSPKLIKLDGIGGLVVSMLASVSRVRGFKPGRSRWIFLYIKILSMPSFGGEVK
jgi:hypothetical protein